MLRGEKINIGGVNEKLSINPFCFNNQGAGRRLFSLEDFARKGLLANSKA